MKSSNKAVHITDDFNLNLLDHDTFKDVQEFLTLIYEKGMIPTIITPTRITGVTTINHIFIHFFIDRNVTATIIKSDVSYHFPIYFIILSLKHQTENETTFIL